jgi:hypothetical protein
VKEGATDEDEDATAFREIDDDQDEDNDPPQPPEGTEDDDDDDELEPSVAESDAALIDEAAAETEESADTPTLTWADVNLGKFTVTKVHYFLGMI